MKQLLLHWPHVLPVLLGFGTVVYLWIANRSSQGAEIATRRSDVDSDPAEGGGGSDVSGVRVAIRPKPATVSPAAGSAPAAVRRETARRGVIVLGPILAATATGATIYGIDLASAHPGRGLVWTHVGVSLLVCLLAIYKLADIDLAQVKEAWRTGHLLDVGASILLGVLLVPLLLSGIVVLVSPSSVSYSAYAHLLASAWWTLLVLWHLTRYLARSVGTITRGRRTPPYRSRRAFLSRGCAVGQGPHRRQCRDSRL